MFGLSRVIRHKGRNGDHRAGLVQQGRRLEPVPVELERGRRVVAAGEVVGEREGQAEHPGELRAEAARTEQPELGRIPRAGHGDELGADAVLEGRDGTEPGQQLDDLVGEVVDRVRTGVTAQH